MAVLKSIGLKVDSSFWSIQKTRFVEIKLEEIKRETSEMNDSIIRKQWSVNEVFDATYTNKLQSDYSLNMQIHKLLNYDHLIDYVVIWSDCIKFPFLSLSDLCST